MISAATLKICNQLLWYINCLLFVYCFCLSCVLEIIQVTAKCEFSPFDGLHLVALATRRRYCSRQLNVLLISNAVLKGNIMMVMLMTINVIIIIINILLVFFNINGID